MRAQSVNLLGKFYIAETFNFFQKLLRFATSFLTQFFHKEQVMQPSGETNSQVIKKDIFIGFITLMAFILSITYLVLFIIQEFITITELRYTTIVIAMVMAIIFLIKWRMEKNFRNLISCVLWIIMTNINSILLLVRHTIE
ncbi:MAG: hypothetical protein A2639_01460 [Candidatus Staskawiczbacteria bacterium RIFCSPHIGHO2_01_FULL_34_27]|uniref:Uncharacterized protein n=1 Tax=Candidatus Staskawiczbacteria bacterium RIFCSPHIGHO2_01_FULL_34_27 TaxID=1802199 RepID=A0A1G2HKI8_9BACT|nr:MAG: hypothetical protein A2639_01460 [Candidatus Staskawiczbacteria bacterium RIFCSPHIGHO2_01_FULL_34_27]